jgi:hypothetical protein
MKIIDVLNIRVGGDVKQTLDDLTRDSGNWEDEISDEITAAAPTWRPRRAGKAHRCGRRHCRVCIALEKAGAL